MEGKNRFALKKAISLFLSLFALSATWDLYMFDFFVLVFVLGMYLLKGFYHQSVEQYIFFPSIVVTLLVTLYFVLTDKYKNKKNFFVLLSLIIINIGVIYIFSPLLYTTSVAYRIVEGAERNVIFADIKHYEHLIKLSQDLYVEGVENSYQKRFLKVAIIRSLLNNNYLLFDIERNKFVIFMPQLKKHYELSDVYFTKDNFPEVFERDVKYIYITSEEIMCVSKNDVNTTKNGVKNGTKERGKKFCRFVTLQQFKKIAPFFISYINKG